MVIKCILTGQTSSVLDGVTENIQTQINTKATDNAVVHLAGNETIFGIKTFTNGIAIKDSTDTTVPKEKLEVAGNIKAIKFKGDGSELINIPYPVTSVIGKTGAVTLVASDIGAQSKIIANGILKGDGLGNISAVDETGSELVSLLDICRQNLLHNWYFPRPVNQRNVSGTISTTGAYFLDRWKLTSGTVTINSDGITLNGTMVQILESAVGAPVVATVLTEAGISEVVPTYSDATKTFTITAQNKKLLGAKLELGSTQTLAHQNGSAWQFNEIPDYGEELAKCQRYCFVPFIGGSIFTRTTFVGTNIVQFFVPTPVTLRAKPKLESGTVNVGAWGSTGLAQGFTYDYAALRNSVRILANKTGHGLNDMWMDLNKVIFSADL